MTAPIEDTPPTLEPIADELQADPEVDAASTAPAAPESADNEKSRASRDAAKYRRQAREAEARVAELEAQADTARVDAEQREESAAAEAREQLEAREAQLTEQAHAFRRANLTREMFGDEEAATIFEGIAGADNLYDEDGNIDREVMSSTRDRLERAFALGKFRHLREGGLPDGVTVTNPGDPGYVDARQPQGTNGATWSALLRAPSAQS